MSNFPDFEGLAFFAKVVEERSFAAAAQTLGVSVSTISRAVGRLEKRLGGRLLNRTSRQVALTEFGRAVAQRASALYRDAEDTEALAHELAAEPRGLLRVAVPMSFGVRWIAPLLPEFFRKYPEVSVDLHLSDDKVDVIGDGFDAALRIAVLPDSSLVARKLCAVSRFILAAPSYIQEHGRPRHPRDLSNHDCLGYAYRSPQDVWRLVHKSGAKESVTPHGRLRVTNADALMPTLLAGLGIAELPEFMASEYLRSGRLKHLLTEWRLEQGGLYFVTPTARDRVAKVEVLATYLSEHLARPAWRIPQDQMER